jgi:hypothetical protein
LEVLAFTWPRSGLARLSRKPLLGAKIDNLVDLASTGTAPASILEKIRELEVLAGRQNRHVEELLLDDGIQLHPLEDGSYRARWTVRGGALFFGGTTKPPVQTEGLEERSTLWVAGAGFEPTTFGL